MDGLAAPLGNCLQLYQRKGEEKGTSKIELQKKFRILDFHTAKK